MVKSKGVEAYLVRYDDNVRYPEHECPATSEEPTSTSVNIYVEAVEDERYAIVVVLTPDFDFKQSPHVKIGRESDNIVRRMVLTSKRIRASFQSKGYFEHRINYTPVQMDGKWKKCALSFKGLHIDEDIDLSPDQVSHKLASIGHIKIEVCCGTVDGWFSAQGLSPAEVFDQSKEVVKDNHVSLSTRYTAVADYVPRQLIDRFVANQDVASQPVSFSLRFRSRTSLQLLKIIPNDNNDDYGAQHPPRSDIETRTGAISVKDRSNGSKKRCAAEAVADELPGSTPSGRAPSDTHQGGTAASIKKEQIDDPLHVTESDDDIEIIEVRGKHHQRASKPVTESVPSIQAAASIPKRERALAEIQLEELDLEERELKVKRRRLELKRQMLGMD